VEVFKYLGGLLVCNDNDVRAGRASLKKAWECWGQLLHVLRAENASPRICEMVYKAAVQAILLFGSEMWNITPAMQKRLEGFHTRTAYLVVCKNKPK